MEGVGQFEEGAMGGAGFSGAAFAAGLSADLILLGEAAGMEMR